MTADDSRQSELRRVSTGIAGLDTILKGGVFEGGAYLVTGAPGMGKTILANQACFAHVKSGGRALYVTLLGELHSRMLQHLRQMEFFDAAAIPEQLYYVSAYQALEENGLPGLSGLLRSEAAAHRASLLVVDSLPIVAASAGEEGLRRFLYQLQSDLAGIGCTALLLTQELPTNYSPEYTLVDGLILLERSTLGARSYRQVEVTKLRGSNFLSGKHSFEITSAGVLVYPRIEAVFSRPSGEDRSRGLRTSIGVKHLDEILDGGVPSGTTTLVLGPSGSGKTVFGLHFVCHASDDDPALLFTFYETPERLLMKARSLNLDLGRLIKAGKLEIIWQPPGEDGIDKIARRLLDAVERRNVRRVFIDGLGGFQAAVHEADRLTEFFGALMNELRIRDVTSIYTGETQVIIGSEVRSPVNGLSMIAENVLLLRFVELRSRLHRIFSVLKVRDSQFDGALREFHIAANGIDLARTIDSAEAIMATQAEEQAAHTERRARKRAQGRRQAT